MRIHGAFRRRRTHYLSVSWECSDWFSAIILHFMMKCRCCFTPASHPKLIHAAAHRPAGLSSVWAVWCLFSGVSNTFWCHKRSGKSAVDVSVEITNQWGFLLLFFLIVVDFLSPPTMDQPINKQLSSSSAALSSPERGETKYGWTGSRTSRSMVDNLTITIWFKKITCRISL